MRDKAAAMALYARQRDDKQMEAWVKEIHLGACIQIGEMSRKLDMAERARDDAKRLLLAAGAAGPISHDCDRSSWRSHPNG